MEEAHNYEGGSSRRSFGGMFSGILSKQLSMDTDTSDRSRKNTAHGGKVKPGYNAKHLLARTSTSSGTGDVHTTPESPLASSLVASSPSAEWVAAGQDAAVNQSWPGGNPHLHTTPTRGLFSKLLSKKRFKGTNSPAGNRSPSLGTSSRGSDSPSSQSAEHLVCIAGADGIPATPPYKQHIQEGFGSVYSTPMGPGTLQSPVAAYSDMYGGETVDLHQVMRQDLPDVFTPGFNELLGNAADKTCKSEPIHPNNMEEPTVMLVSGAQLAQAGQLYNASSMLFATQPPDSSIMAISSPSACEAEGSDIDIEVSQQQPQDCAMHAVVVTDAAGDGTLLPDREDMPAACAADVQCALGDAGAAASGGQLQAECSKDDVCSLATVVADAVLSATADVTSTSAEPSAADGCEDPAFHNGSEAHEAADCDREQLLPSSESSVQELALVDTSEQQTSTDASAAWPELEPSAVDMAPDNVISEAAETVAPAAAGETTCTITNQQLDAASLRYEPEATATAADVFVLAGDTAEAIAGNDCVPAHDPHSVAQETPVVTQPLPVHPAVGPVIPAAPTPGQALTAANDAEEAPEAPLEHVITADTTIALDTATGCQHAAELSETSQTAQQAEQQQHDTASKVDEAPSASHLLAPDCPELCAVTYDRLSESPSAAAEPAASSGDDLQHIRTCRPGMHSSAVQPMLLEQIAESSETEKSTAAGLASVADAQWSAGQVIDTVDAVALPLPGDDERIDSEEPGSPVAAVPATGIPPTPLGSESPAQQPAVPSPLNLSSSRKSRESPIHLVRESMPLFLADPSKAMGSPLALEEEDLDDQDLQQIIGRSAQHLAASLKPSLLTHGGPQRVAVGPLGSTFLSSLEPVAEASFNSADSPVSERTSSFTGTDAGATSSRQLDLNNEMSPMQPRRLSNSPQGTPATAQPATGSPNLAGTPGSVYSTPTLAFNTGAVTGQGTDTPQSGLTNVSVGSAIRQITPPAVGGLDLSLAMRDLPEPSPTLVLMPGATGLSDTSTGLQAPSGDGTTPSLLDARAASPSAVYTTRFMATPFRGALAALPMDAALAAPLIDSSPFQLSDCGMDTVCLADEAQRVAANLAIAASGFGVTPVRTTGVNIPQPATSPASAASQGRTAATAGSPTEELRDLHVVMLTKQLAEMQKKLKDLEGENLRLKEQVEIYEFEKTELNSQEEMEKQARQYAEEQLEDMRVEMQKLLQANNAQAQQVLSMQQEFHHKQHEAQTRYDALKQDHTQLTNTIAQLQDERNQVLDKLNLVDMQVTALKSSNADLSAAVEAEQQRCAELEAALAARDRDLAEAGRCSIESQARLEKMMEQLIAANTAKEHARQKAADEAAKLQQMMSERQQLLAERQAMVLEREKYVALKRKYAQKTTALAETEHKLQAKEAENQELMAMCDQLLQQQEARRQ